MFVVEQRRTRGCVLSRPRTLSLLANIVDRLARLVQLARWRRRLVADGTYRAATVALNANAAVTASTQESTQVVTASP
jgi:hypothetical protein